MKLIDDDRIDQYLAGELQGEDLKGFEAEMDKDESLRTSVEFFREVARSASRVHDLEVLKKHREESFGYRWRLFWAKFKMTVVAIISAIGITAAGIGADAIMAIQKFMQATTPYITQLAPAVARDGDDAFDGIQSGFGRIETLLDAKDAYSAQQELDKIMDALSDIKADGLHDENDIIGYSQAAEFTQAVIYAQSGKGVMARRIFKRIARDDSHIYHNDAKEILEKSKEDHRHKE